MCCILIFGFVFVLLIMFVVMVNDMVVLDGFEQFLVFNDEFGMCIDYGMLFEIFGGIVLNVLLMDWIFECGCVIIIGMCLSSENILCYCYEGNWVIFYLLFEEYQIVIIQYCEELEVIFFQIEFGNLLSDEQFVYWLNLYNIVVIEQIMQVYFVFDVECICVGENCECLYDVKIFMVVGVLFSFNDICLCIVYE